MTVDKAVQALIDAALDPVKADVKDAEGTLLVHDRQIIDVINRVIALEGKPVPPPPPPPPPTPGVPVIDPALGKVFRKVFADGTLAPFSVATWPDDHIGGSGQWMTVFCRYRGHAAPSVHDGYLDLRAVKRPTGNLWDADFVQTSQGGSGLTFGYGITRFWLRFNLGPAVWQAAWLYDTTSWSADEIDFPEMLENQRLTGNVLGTGAGKTTGPIPADIATVFHVFSIERRAGFTAFAIDGKECGRVTSGQSNKKLAILLDSKVGHGWVGASGGITSATPNPTWLHVAAVTVDA